MNISREQAEAVARWWADRLKNPKFDNLGPTRGDNLQETAVNSFASTLASLNAGPQPDDDQLENFRVALVEGVLKLSGFTSLYSDYSPDRTLYEAAQAASINPSRFPWKTGTWFGANGTVLAACGYGAPHVQIYPEVKFLRSEEASNVNP